MELKQFKVVKPIGVATVLIAPLWNWNAATNTGYRSAATVLIAPLWNWNRYKDAYYEYIKSLNRTFMELKRGYEHWLPLSG